MSEMIPSDSVSIMDIGCGNGRLKKYLPKNIETYYGVDYVARDNETIVCDLNRERLPEISVDVYYLAGVIMYINDVKSLFMSMRNARYIIFNYMDELSAIRLDYGHADINAFMINRRKDYLSIADIINYLIDAGFNIDCIQYDFRTLNQYYIRAINNKV